MAELRAIEYLKSNKICDIMTKLEQPNFFLFTEFRAININPSWKAYNYFKPKILSIFFEMVWQFDNLKEYLNFTSGLVILTLCKSPKTSIVYVKYLLILEIFLTQSKCNVSFLLLLFYKNSDKKLG